jgi:SAM-dependent methyltransferase
VKKGAYNASWFAAREESVEASARVVVPLLREMVHPTSIVDVGCGLGGWLAVFRDHGVEDVLGIDGDYVDRTALKIPLERFLARDLEHPLHVGQNFDLALSLEVGEHMPQRLAPTLVDSLVRLAPVVVFSSAIPHQSGTGHINEQWPEFWVSLFAERGYSAVDCLRKRLWNDRRVRYFYAQNAVVYVEEDKLQGYPLLAAAHALDPTPPLHIVHPHLYRSALSRFPPPEVVTLRPLLGFARRLVRQKVMPRNSR